MKNMKYKKISILALLMFGSILAGCGCDNNVDPSNNSESITPSNSIKDSSITSDISELESIVMSDVPTK